MGSVTTMMVGLLTVVMAGSVVEVIQVVVQTLFFRPLFQGTPDGQRLGVQFFLAQRFVHGLELAAGFIVKVVLELVFEVFDLLVLAELVLVRIEFRRQLVLGLILELVVGVALR